MQILKFEDGRKPTSLDRLEELPGDGYVWLDFVREEEPKWHDEVARLTGTAIFEAHVVDSLNARHPSYFDGTESYDMVVFRGLAPDATVDRFDSHPTAFFLLDRMLVTVRPASSVSVGAVRERLREQTARAPARAAGLMLLVLNAMIDRYLAMREPLEDRLDRWETSLLDPDDPFDDWMTLIRHRNEFRRLERLCNEQVDALTDWREGNVVDIDDSLSVRVNDVVEHTERVLNQSRHLQAQLEALVQIHFAATAHRTNEIMRVLTIVAAVFLPLSLIAGIFGMNFVHMPELKLRYAYPCVLALMLLVGGGMLYYFRRRKWL